MSVFLLNKVKHISYSSFQKYNIFERFFRDSLKTRIALIIYQNNHSQNIVTDFYRHIMFNLPIYLFNQQRHKILYNVFVSDL